MATSPEEWAAERLHEAGYLYLGIKDRPKPIEGAHSIIRAAIGEATSDLRAQLERAEHKRDQYYEMALDKWGGTVEAMNASTEARQKLSAQLEAANKNRLEDIETFKGMMKQRDAQLEAAQAELAKIQEEAYRDDGGHLGVCCLWCWAPRDIPHGDRCPLASTDDSWLREHDAALVLRVGRCKCGCLFTEHGKRTDKSWRDGYSASRKGMGLCTLSQETLVAGALRNRASTAPEGEPRE